MLLQRLDATLSLQRTMEAGSFSEAEIAAACAGSPIFAHLYHAVYRKMGRRQRNVLRDLRRAFDSNAGREFLGEFVCMDV